MLIGMTFRVLSCHFVANHLPKAEYICVYQLLYGDARYCVSTIKKIDD